MKCIGCLDAVFSGRTVLGEVDGVKHQFSWGVIDDNGMPLGRWALHVADEIFVGRRPLNPTA